MSAGLHSAAAHDFRFGEYLAQGLEAYRLQFKPWVNLMLIAAAIALVASLCCVLPYWLVAGPLACGLHHCGLLAIRGEPVSWDGLKHGFKRAGTAMVAFFSLMAMGVVPMVLLFMVGYAATIAVVMATMFGTMGPRGFQQGGGPEPLQVGVMIVVWMMSYGFMFLGILASIVWWCWFSAKTMYAMPLIADRRCSAFEAIQESWRLTKSRTWELVLLQFLAGTVAGIGTYLFGIGMVFTLPFYFTAIAAAYENHALPQFTPPAAESPLPAIEPTYLSISESPADV